MGPVVVAGGEEEAVEVVVEAEVKTTRMAFVVSIQQTVDYCLGCVIWRALRAGTLQNDQNLLARQKEAGRGMECKYLEREDCETPDGDLGPLQPVLGALLFLVESGRGKELVWRSGRAKKKRRLRCAQGGKRSFRIGMASFTRHRQENSH